MSTDTPATPAAPLGRERRRAVFSRRLLSTLGLWVVVGAVAWSGSGVAVLGLLGLLSALALREYLHLAADLLDRPARAVVGLVAGAYFIAEGYWLASGGTPGRFGFDVAAVFAVVAGLFAVEMRRPLRGRETFTVITAGLFGLVYIPLFFYGFVARVVYTGGGEGTVAAAGIPLMLFFVAVTKFTDMGAYAVGSLIGKHKMIPHISPGKTWQGFGGALFGAVVAGLGLALLFPAAMAPVTPGRAFALALVLGLVGVFGDLVESVVKRCLGAKDSGHALPGIGGVLDLIDSLCFTAPVFYLLLQWLGRG
jgi:phosphatidate cytidylyltransferase